MSESLEELRAQRDLIQQHLNWLDAQITSAEEEGSTEQRTTAGHQAAVAARAVTAPVETPTAAVAPNYAPAESTTPYPPTLEFDEAHHPSSKTSDLKRAQIGCFLFFSIAILLFLFLLFGLPYLVD